MTLQEKIERFEKAVDAILDDGRQRDIIKARARGETLEGVGRRYRVTRERVRQRIKEIRLHLVSKDTLVLALFDEINNDRRAGRQYKRVEEAAEKRRNLRKYVSDPRKGMPTYFEVCAATGIEVNSSVDLFGQEMLQRLYSDHKLPRMFGLQRCVHCKVFLEPQKFPGNKLRQSGGSNTCRRCSAIWHKYYREANKERCEEVRRASVRRVEKLDPGHARKLTKKYKMRKALGVSRPKSKYGSMLYQSATWQEAVQKALREPEG